MPAALESCLSCIERRGWCLLMVLGSAGLPSRHKALRDLWDSALSFRAANTSTKTHRVTVQLVQSDRGSGCSTASATSAYFRLLLKNPGWYRHKGLLKAIQFAPLSSLHLLPDCYSSHRERRIWDGSQRILSAWWSTGRSKTDRWWWWSMTRDSHRQQNQMWCDFRWGKKGSKPSLIKQNHHFLSHSHYMLQVKRQASQWPQFKTALKHDCELSWCDWLVINHH